MAGAALGSVADDAGEDGGDRPGLEYPDSGAEMAGAPAPVGLPLPAGIGVAGVKAAGEEAAGGEAAGEAAAGEAAAGEVAAGAGETVPRGLAEDELGTGSRFGGLAAGVPPPVTGVPGDMVGCCKGCG